MSSGCYKAAFASFVLSSNLGVHDLICCIGRLHEFLFDNCKNLICSGCTYGFSIVEKLVNSGAIIIFQVGQNCDQAVGESFAADFFIEAVVVAIAARGQAALAHEAQAFISRVSRDFWPFCRVWPDLNALTHQSLLNLRDGIFFCGGPFDGQA